MPPPHRGGGGSSQGGLCTQSGIRNVLLGLFVVYCVLLYTHNTQQEAPRRHIYRTPRLLAQQQSMRATTAGPSAVVPAAQPQSQVHAGSVSAACTASSELATLARVTPISGRDAGGTGDEPLAAGDRASVHVPALTVSFCEKYAVNRALITTASDQKYMIWARNWAKSLQAHGVRNLFIGAMDAEAQKLSHAEGIPSVLLGRMRAGTTWHSANRYKIRLVQGVVELGFDVLFTDADVTFIRDPMPFILQYPEAGVLISTDLLIREKPYPMQNGLENTYEIHGKYRADLNVGLMFVRATSATTRMMNHWADVANADMSKSMQTFFVKLVREYASCEPLPGHPELSNCYNGTVPVGLLPMDKFCGGYIYFVERLPQRMNIEAISVHATYQVHQGLDGKRERLRHAHLWFLDDADYFAPKGGILTMAPMELPHWVTDPAAVRRYQEGGDLKDDHRNRTLVHFDLVHYQLRQLRNAMAVAQMLGRTLVMPDFTVLIDNTWYPMNGAWPGFRKLGPFVAPLDHILHMTQLKNNNIDYRSSTFLEHPCVKPTVGPAATARVSFVDGAAAPNAVDPTSNKIALPKGATEAQVVAALKGHPAKVVHLESTMDVIKGFDDPSAQANFASKINRTPMLWCCITKNVANDIFKQPFPPGHIYYDFWYDQPHTDRFQRRYTDKWELRVGP